MGSRIVLMYSQRMLCFVLSFFIMYTPTSSYAQSMMLPQLGVMVGVSDTFTPILVKGLTVNPNEPLNFNFIIDSGDATDGEAFIKEESRRMAKYFLAAITVPEKQLWVNLSPYEQDRMVEEDLGQTVLGQDMLTQDYLLKQLSASLVHPDQALGKAFWKRVYADAQEKYGTTEVPTDLFHKVWIMPGEAEVFEKGSSVYVTRANLKVMLESDYVAQKAQGTRQKTQDVIASEAKQSQQDIISVMPTRGHSASQQDDQRGSVSSSRLPSNLGLNGEATHGADQSLSTNIMREVILPAIEKEVNQGKNFAKTRQIYHAAILATWYRELIEDTLLSEAYVGTNQVDGVTSVNQTGKEEIYQQYIAAYKKGVVDLIKEEKDPLTGEVVPRQYFSGGFDEFGDIALQKTESTAGVVSKGKTFKVDFAMASDTDAAMGLSVSAEEALKYQEESHQRILTYAAQAEEKFNHLKDTGVAEVIKPEPGTRESFFSHVQVSDSEKIKHVYEKTQEMVREVLGQDANVLDMETDSIHVTISNSDVYENGENYLNLQELLKETQEDAQGLGSFEIQLIGPRLMSDGVVIMEYTTSAPEFLHLRNKANERIQQRRKNRKLSSGNTARTPNIFHSTVSSIHDVTVSPKQLKRLFDDLNEYRKDLEPISYQIKEITVTNFREKDRSFIDSRKIVLDNTDAAMFGEPWTLNGARKILDQGSTYLRLWGSRNNNVMKAIQKIGEGEKNSADVGRLMAVFSTDYLNDDRISKLAASYLTDEQVLKGYGEALLLEGVSFQNKFKAAESLGRIGTEQALGFLIKVLPILEQEKRYDLFNKVSDILHAFDNSSGNVLYQKVVVGKEYRHQEGHFVNAGSSYIDSNRARSEESGYDLEYERDTDWVVDQVAGYYDKLDWQKFFRSEISAFPKNTSDAAMGAELLEWSSEHRVLAASGALVALGFARLAHSWAFYKGLYPKSVYERKLQVLKRKRASDRPQTMMSELYYTRNAPKGISPEEYQIFLNKIVAVEEILLKKTNIDAAEMSDSLAWVQRPLDLSLSPEVAELNEGVSFIKRHALLRGPFSEEEIDAAMGAQESEMLYIVAVFAGVLGFMVFATGMHLLFEWINGELSFMYHDIVNRPRTLGAAREILDEKKENSYSFLMTAVRILGKLRKKDNVDILRLQKALFSRYEDVGNRARKYLSKEQLEVAESLKTKVLSEISSWPYGYDESPTFEVMGDVLELYYQGFEFELEYHGERYRSEEVWDTYEYNGGYQSDGHDPYYGTEVPGTRRTVQVLDSLGFISVSRGERLGKQNEGPSQVGGQDSDAAMLDGLKSTSTLISIFNGEEKIKDILLKRKVKLNHFKELKESRFRNYPNWMQEVLTAWGADKDMLFQANLESLKGENPKKAIEMLVDSGDKRAAEGIASLFSHSRQDVRAVARKAQEDLGAEKDFLILANRRALKNSKSSDAFREAIKLIEQLGGEDAIKGGVPFLIDKLSEFERSSVSKEEEASFYNEVSDVLYRVGHEKGNWKYEPLTEPAEELVEEEISGGWGSSDHAPTETQTFYRTYDKVIGWRKVLRSEVSESDAEKVDSDPAQVGGIDIQDIDVKYQGARAVQFNGEAVRAVIQNGFHGFTPILMSITPIKNPLVVMGLN